MLDGMGAPSEEGAAALASNDSESSDVLDSSLGGIIWKATSVAAGMAGIRLDAGRRLLIWLPAVFVVVMLGEMAIRNDLLLPYALATWAFYYLGIGIVLGTGVKRWMRDRWGEDRAWKIYEVICGIQFFTIGSGFAAAAMIGADTLNISNSMAFIIAVPVFVVGFGVKFWATWIVGMDTYYYRDLFLEKAHGEFTAKGPYQKLANPMYGVGNWHGYAVALLAGSTAGLVFAAVCHLSIYGFYFIVEKPFIVELYS